MPSNQPPRPLTRPHHRSKSSGGQPFLVSASSYVIRANRFLTFFSTCFLAFTFLFTLRSADEIESYARGGTQKLEQYAGSHWPGGTSGSKCNAFRLPGWIEKGTTAAQLPIWRTFSRDCAGHNVLSLLSQTEAAAASIPALAHLRNETILIVSDARPNQKRLADLCGLVAGGRVSKVDVSHPWGGVFQTQKAQDPHGDGLGSYCYIPSIDLLIYHFPQGALYQASSVTAESRMASLLSHVLSMWSTTPSNTPSLPLARKKTTPALTIWGSSYDADLQAWQSSLGAGTPLNNEDTLNHWRTRNLEALSVLDRILSSSRRSDRSRASPVIQWQSPGYGDIAESPIHPPGVSSASNLNPGVVDSHALTAPVYSAIISLIDKSKAHASSDPLFEKLKAAKTPHDVPAGLKTEFEWRRVSQEIQDEKTAAAVWGEMLFAALAEVV